MGSWYGVFQMCTVPFPPSEGTNYMALMECSYYFLRTRNFSSIKNNGLCLFLSIFIFPRPLSVIRLLNKGTISIFLSISA